MPKTRDPLWFDAHLDLACLAVCGRDLTAPLGALRASSAGPWPPAGVSLPALRDGNVRLALATIFTQAVDGPLPSSEPWPGEYRLGDVDAASRKGRAQLEVYRTWADAGLIDLDLRDLLQRDREVGEIRGGMGVSELVPETLEQRLATLDRGNGAAPRLHVGILMENADPIRGPEELDWWVQRGVVAIGLAWAIESRYAAGNGTPDARDRGLTPEGRELVAAMDAQRVVHDLSHLSDRSMDELLSRSDRMVVASHSNCRALFSPPGNANQRHLRDASIREIGRRGGVVGLNLFRRFLCDPPAGGWSTATAHGPRPTIADAVRHVEHVCEVMGHRRGVGLGSDMDGGFSALEMCAGIESPAELVRLTDALAARGWSDDEVRGFTHLNWQRCLAAALSV